MGLLDDLAEQARTFEKDLSIPDEFRMSDTMRLALRRKIGVTEQADIHHAYPGTAFAGIPIRVDPAVPEGEFWFVRDGTVIGKIRPTDINTEETDAEPK